MHEKQHLSSDIQTQSSPNDLFFVLASEKSASIYGAQLIKQLHALRSKAKFFGTGGLDMVEAGLQEIVPFSNFQVMGITPVILKLPTLIYSFIKLAREIIENNPAYVIFIDQPAFSLRLAKTLRKKGYSGKIVQYVAPSVWAYKEKRIAELEKSFDLLLTLFPFEPAYFQNSKLPTIFCGHPLINIVNQQKATDFKSAHAIGTHKVIALFPGSRIQEVKDNLWLQLQAAASFDGLIAISIAHKELESLAMQMAQKLNIDKKIRYIAYEERYDLMRIASCAIAKSGTVTLELALLNVPTVVTYSLSWLNYLVAKYIFQLKLKNYCIVNILLGKEVFPECIGFKLDPGNIKYQLEKIQFSKTDQQQLVKMLTVDKTVASRAILELYEPKI